FGVGIGLFASLVVSITIIPVLYYLFYKKAHKKDRIQEGKITKMLRKVNLFNIEENYAKGFDWVFGYRKVSTVICVDRKSTRLNSSHVKISYAVFCLKKKKKKKSIKKYIN